MVTKTEAINNFLQAKAPERFAKLYSPNMECQVNAAQDGGERVEKDYHGRKWHGWTDGLTIWKSFRIPRNANSDPEYEDTKMAWDLELHAEAIGMTGWDWKNRCSKWVGFDFDDLVGHSENHRKKLSQQELDEVRTTACEIEWVTVLRSTSGKGLHLYVFLDDVPTQNHNEHAALGRSIIGKLSALTGFDFESKVDVCGSNMWVWHRKCVGTNGFECLKEGSVLTEIPPNWKDHVVVVSGKRRRNIPQNIDEDGTLDLFEELISQRPKVRLDDTHKALIEYFKEVDAFWWWDQDHQMLVTHTYWLKKAFEDLTLKGCFDTMSDASNINEQNC